MKHKQADGKVPLFGSHIHTFHSPQRVRFQPVQQAGSFLSFKKKSSKIALVSSKPQVSKAPRVYSFPLKYTFTSWSVLMFVWV